MNDSKRNISIIEEKYNKFKKDILSERMLLFKINQIFTYEFEEMFEDILILNEDNFMSNLKNSVESEFEGIYSDKILSERKFTNILEKGLNTIKSEYKMNYDILYDIYDTYLKNKLSRKNEIEFLKNNYRRHCLNEVNNDFATHSCDSKSGKFLLGKKNGKIEYVICINCKKAYFSHMILCKCYKCNKEYYTEILSKNEDEFLLPATWEKYHCKQIVNEKIQCIKCHDIFYINMKTGMLSCLNNKCNFVSNPSRILWTCSICQQDFKCGAIPYNPLDLEIVKKIIIQTLFQKQRAHPNKVPCCKVNVFFTEFYHKKKCQGILYTGELNGDIIIVCEKCHAINYYDRFIWTCPKCGNKFNDKENRILEDTSDIQDNSYNTISTEDKKKTEPYLSDKNSSKIDDDYSSNSNSSKKREFCKNKKSFFSNKSGDNNNKSEIKNMYNKNFEKVEKNIDQNKQPKSFGKLYSTRFLKRFQNNDTNKIKEKDDDKGKEKDIKKEIYNTEEKREKDEHLSSRRYQRLRFFTEFGNKKDEKIKEKEKEKEKETEKERNNNESPNKEVQKRKIEKVTLNMFAKYRQKRKMEEKEKEDRERKEREERNKRKKEEIEEKERIKREEKERKEREKREEKQRERKEKREREKREREEREEREKREREEREKREREEREEREKREREEREKREKREREEREEREKREREEKEKEEKRYSLSNKKIGPYRSLKRNFGKKEDNTELTSSNNLEKSEKKERFKKSLFGKRLKEEPKLEEEEEVEEDDTNIKNRNKTNKIEEIQNEPKKKENVSNFHRWKFRRPEAKRTLGKVIKEETESTSHSNNNNTDKINSNEDNSNTNTHDNNKIPENNNNNNITVNPITKIPGISDNLLNHLNKRISNIISKCSIPLMNVEDYIIHRKIGEGSYGIIFSAINKKDKKQYALKKIISNKLKQFEEFIKEFELVYSCKHEGIMKIYSFCIRILDPTTYALYVLMELAERDWDKEIKKKLSKRKNYSEKELVNILYQLVSALLYIQENYHISHRDIKPQNVLVFPGGIYKLADFGEAKEAKVSKQINTLRGTELYMSPALYDGLKKEKNDVSHNPFKSDVFSLGFCFLYASAMNFNLLYKVRDILDSQNINVILHKFLNKFYCEKLIMLLASMLEIDETKRYDFSTIKEYIEKNFSDMINKNI